MNFKWLLRQIGSTIYENRSNIEFITGNVLVIAGTGLAISKAEDAVEVKHEMERQIKTIELTDEANGWEDNRERTKACFSMAKTTVVGYGKVYGIPLGMEAAGLALMAVSHATDRNEIATKAAALTSLATQFYNYRENVRKDQGEEKDQEYLTGLTSDEQKMLTDGTLLDKDGKPYTVPDHTFLFDETNDDFEKEGTMNYDLLDNKERWLSEELWHKGFLTENYIRSYCKAAESVTAAEGDWGITAVDENGNRQYVVLGINKNTQMAKDFRDGKEKSFLCVLDNMEPNVHRKLYRLNKYHNHEHILIAP